MKFAVFAVVATFFALGIVADPQAMPQIFKRTDCEDVWCYNSRTGESNECECIGSICQAASEDGVISVCT